MKTPASSQVHAAAVSHSNWDELRRRIETAQLAFERSQSPAPAEKQKLLRARARALAQEAAPEAAAGPALHILEFLLAGEHYGLESAFVSEVYPLTEYTPLPHTPPFVLGIITVRGRILSVVDLRYFFDLPCKGLTELNKILILRHGDMEFGILADAVTRVSFIPQAEIQPSLPTLTGIRERYLKGVTAGCTVILDAVKILGDPQLIVHEQVESPQLNSPA